LFWGDDIGWIIGNRLVLVVASPNTQEEFNLQAFNFLLSEQAQKMKTQISIVTSVFSFLRILVLNNTAYAGSGKHRSDSSFPLSRIGMVMGASIFVLSAGALLLIYLTMPNLDPRVLKIPKDLADLQVMK
jgi:hypothetical protein